MFLISLGLNDEKSVIAHPDYSYNEMINCINTGKEFDVYDFTIIDNKYCINFSYEMRINKSLIPCISIRRIYSEDVKLNK